MIPIIGNIVIGISDFSLRKYDNHEFMLAALRRDLGRWKGDKVLAKASERLRNDPSFMLAVANNNLASLQYASADLKRNKAFMLDVVEIIKGAKLPNRDNQYTHRGEQRCGSEIFRDYCDPSLFSDQDFMFDVDSKSFVKYSDGWNGESEINVFWLSQELRKNKEFALRCFENKPRSAFYEKLDAILRDDEAFVLDLIKKDTERKMHITNISLNRRYAENKDFMLKAIDIDEKRFNQASGLLHNDPEFMLAAIKKVPTIALDYIERSKQLTDNQQFLIEVKKVILDKLKELNDSSIPLQDECALREHMEKLEKYLENCNQ